jgi:hypothetical protein
MKLGNRSAIRTLLAVALLHPAAALAAGDGLEAKPAEGLNPPAPMAGTDPHGSLQVKEQNGISFVSGGAGDEEQGAIEQMSSRFNLKLTAATPSGKYTAPSSIQIMDQQGKPLVETTPSGPLFLAKLPPGAYTLHVTTGGETKKRAIMVPQSGQEQLVLTWGSLEDEPSSAGDAPEPKPAPEEKAHDLH